MSSASPEKASTASWHLDNDTLYLQGAWTLLQLSGRLTRVQEELVRLGTGKDWNLEQVDKLDNLGALLLWRCWGRHFPEQLQLRAQHRPLFERLAHIQPLQPKHRVPGLFAVLDQLGRHIVAVLQDLWGLFLLWGNLLQEFFYALARPAHFPWKEISATIVRTGPDSLPILSLIGFLIGIVITYQSAPTLASYGANIYVISIAGISILREFGPMIAAIIIAGRSGSAFTAQIGAMRVTQELDALQTFGVSPVQRLILPKVIALAITMPLLVIWTDLVGIFGALLVSNFSLNISPDFFLRELPVMVPSFNFWLGVVKGVLYGILIAWVSGYHGLRVQPNTNSLSRETTNSVVLSITLVIVIDAILAILFADVGLAPA